MERCRREILAAARGQAGWEETMRLVGVTEKGRAAWRRQLLGRLKWKRFNDTEEAALSLAHLQERARAIILEPDRHRPQEVEIVVNLGGDPPLSVQARGLVHYGMVPWTVRLGSQSWESDSLRIPRALDELFGDAMIGGPDLMGSPALWEFWRDAALPQDLRGRFSCRVLQVAPEATEANLLFDWREYQGPRDRILLRHGIIRDWPGWSTVDHLGLPDWNWHFIIEHYKKCLQTAHRQRWLINWLQATPDRFLTKPNEGPDLDLSYLDAGDVILDLREGGLERGEVALNSTDGSCHILKAVPAKAVHHWFDTLQLDLRAKNGTFAKVFGDRVETYTWNSPYGPATRIK